MGLALEVSVVSLSVSAFLGSSGNVGAGQGADGYRSDTLECFNLSRKGEFLSCQASTFNSSLINPSFARHSAILPRMPRLSRMPMRVSLRSRQAVVCRVDHCLRSMARCP